MGNSTPGMEFATLVKGKEYKIGLEVGLAEGDHIRILLAECPTIEHLYGVDPYLHREAGHTYHLDTNNVEQKEMNKRMASLKNIDPEKFTHYRMTSEEAGRLFHEESLDFVYIDGDHSSLMVALDIKTWLPKIKKGGMLAGHDMHFDSVKDVVDKVFSEYRVNRDSWYVEL